MSFHKGSFSVFVAGVSVNGLFYAIWDTGLSESCIAPVYGTFVTSACYVQFSIPSILTLLIAYLTLDREVFVLSILRCVSLVVNDD